MRLVDIDPRAVADATADALAIRLRRLDPGPARRALYAVATYAAGEAPACGDIDDHIDTVTEIAGLLGELSGAWAVHPVTPLQVVLVAAPALLRLDRDEPITSSQLAALASVSQGRIARMQAAGEAPGGERLETERARPRMVPAADALAWLRSRGVAV